VTPVHGRLVGIYTAPDAAMPMRSHDQLLAVERVGLDGDRYAKRTGTYSPRGGPGREITLIEREAIAALNQDPGVELAERETRRNLVTDGVSLTLLVGRTFCVGDVVLRGVRTCPPCTHLESLTRSGVRQALADRGGLRADIVRGGTLRIGDEIVVNESGAQREPS
jgi:MOSC domain-containing protein YiiM